MLHYDLKFAFPQLPADFLLYQVKNTDVSKKASRSLIFVLLFYRYLVKTILRQVCFILNKYKSNLLKGEFQWLPDPQYI